MIMRTILNTVTGSYYDNENHSQYDRGYGITIMRTILNKVGDKGLR